MKARLSLSTLAYLLISFSGCAEAPISNDDRGSNDTSVSNDKPLSNSTKETVRIASTSLCADSYVLAHAPSHISALSFQSRDNLSRASTAQRALPQARDDAETLLALAPTHVIFGPGEGDKSKAVLQASGIKTMSLIWGEDFAAVDKNAQALQGFIGIGQDFIGIDHASPKREDAPALQSVPSSETISTSKNISGPRVLYLSRSGGTAGAGTFIDAAIRAAGGVNFITQKGWVAAQPERLITAAPDLIITSYFSDGYESAQSNGLRHKAFQDLIARTPSLDIAGALWPCAGPGLYEAANMIRAAIKALQ